MVIIIIILIEIILIVIIMIISIIVALADTYYYRYKCIRHTSSQCCHRSPRVRKQATECLARWWIQPARGEKPVTQQHKY